MPRGTEGRGRDQTSLAGQTVADHCRALRSRRLFSIPGLLGRIKIAESPMTVDRPRSVHSPQGRHCRNWESIALEENDLGGLRRQPRLDCWGARRGLPHTAFPDSKPLSGGLPKGKLCTARPGLRVLGALGFVRRRWLVEGVPQLTQVRN